MYLALAHVLLAVSMRDLPHHVVGPHSADIIQNVQQIPPPAQQPDVPEGAVAVFPYVATLHNRFVKPLPVVCNRPAMGYRTVTPTDPGLNVSLDLFPAVHVSYEQLQLTARSPGIPTRSRPRLIL
jgi:hypothetical protein